MLSLPDVKERFLNASIEIAVSSPEQFAATIKSDMAKWGKVIRERVSSLNNRGRAMPQNNAIQRSYT